MTSAVFLLSKSPYAEHQDGETRISRLLLEAAAQSADVRGLALADSPADPGPVSVSEVAKPRLRMARLGAASLARRRSLLHTRFAPTKLVRAVVELDPEAVLVARRLYMAQAALDAGKAGEGASLVVLADVLESAVMRQRGGAARPLFELEARRTWRDEVRCAQAATLVSCLSETERAELVGELVTGPGRLDLVLPPAERPASLDDPVALFVGDTRWPPNRKAAEEVLEIWPAIHAACPAARLVMAGRGTDEIASGGNAIEGLGWVDDIDAIWHTAGILIAPVEVGGGVRVKILDAVCNGVPVVASEAAIGSTSEYLPLRASGSKDELITAAAELLSDRAARRSAGQALFDANRDLVREGFVERQLEALINP